MRHGWLRRHLAPIGPIASVPSPPPLRRMPTARKLCPDIVRELFHVFIQLFPRLLFEFIDLLLRDFRLRGSGDGRIAISSFFRRSSRKRLPFRIPKIGKYCKIEV